MKKQLLTLALAVGLSMSAYSQSTAENLYERYSKGEGIVALTLPKFLLEDIELDMDLDKQMRELEGEIENIRLLVFSEESEPQKRLMRLHNDLLQEDLEEIKPDGKHRADDLSFLKLYGERDGSYYRTIYLLLASDDGQTAVFAAVSGKIKISQNL